jgi:hypothetical protein
MLRSVSGASPSETGNRKVTNVTLTTEPKPSATAPKVAPARGPAALATEPAPRASAQAWDARISLALDTLEKDGTLAGPLPEKVRARLMLRAARIVTAEERNATRWGRMKPLRIAAKVATLIAQQTATLTESMAAGKTALRKADAIDVASKALPKVDAVAWTLVLTQGTLIRRLTAHGRDKVEAKADAVARDGAEWARAKVYRPELAPQA